MQGQIAGHDRPAPTYRGRCGHPIPAGGSDCLVCEDERRVEAERARRHAHEAARRAALGLRPLDRTRHRAHWAAAALVEALEDLARVAGDEDIGGAVHRALGLVNRAQAELERVRRITA